MSLEPAHQVLPMSAIEGLREQAVSQIVDAIYARHPGLTQRFGPRGLQATREDINHHLDYLDSALATGEDVLFTDYAIWLKEVLSSRGVPDGLLAESFELLDGFFAEHLPTEVTQKVGAILVAARDALGRNDLPTPYVYSRLPPLADATRYRNAALSGEHKAAQEFMSGAMQAGATLTEASVRLIQPALHEIGSLWQTNRITVSQEHLATAVSQNILARAYLQADFAPPVGRTAMFACVAGNQHSLGLRMLSDAFETIGWDVLYLGANVPLADLIRQVDASGPDLLALSLSLPVHLGVARETTERLRAELGNRCPPIWIGGLPTQLDDGIRRSLKADGWAADALQALDQMRDSR